MGNNLSPTDWGWQYRNGILVPFSYTHAPAISVLNIVIVRSTKFVLVFRLLCFHRLCPGKKKECGFGDLKCRLTSVLIMIWFFLIFDVGVCKLAISPGDEIDKPVSHVTDRKQLNMIFTSNASLIDCILGKA